VLKKRIYQEYIIKFVNDVDTIRNVLILSYLKIVVIKRLQNNINENVDELLN